MKEVIPRALLAFSLLVGCTPNNKPRPLESLPAPLEQVSQTVKEIEKVVGDISIMVNDLSGIVNLGVSSVKNVDDMGRTIGIDGK